MFPVYMYIFDNASLNTIVSAVPFQKWSDIWEV